MGPSRQLHEEGLVAKDAVVAELLMESLGKPTPRKESEPRKAKEAEVFTCRVCPAQYTDATERGGDGKRNCGFCSRECRTAKRKGVRKQPTPRKAKGPRRRAECVHGRRRSRCNGLRHGAVQARPR